MDTTFVTAFSGAGFKEYGKRLLDSFVANNSHGFPLHVYTNDMTESLGYKNVVHMYQEDISEQNDFLKRWRKDMRVHGKSLMPKWKERDIRTGYCYKYDMYKFCRMIFVMWRAAKLCGTRYMVWLDGDNVVRQDIPADLVDRSLRGKSYAYLGRNKMHTETGFLVFDLNESMPILDQWASYLINDTFLDEGEWHSAYLFDRAREACPDVVGHNLTPDVDKGHVIHESWVGLYFDHLKGKRKTRGRSQEAKPC